MSALRNEVDDSDPTDHSARAPMGLTIAFMGALHALCCGLPLLLLSGVSLTTLLPISSMTGGILALLALASFVWHRKKSNAACAESALGCRAGELKARENILKARRTRGS